MNLFTLIDLLNEQVEYMKHYKQHINYKHCYIYTFPSIPSVLMFYSVEEPNNLIKAILVGVVAFVASFIITAVLYHDQKKLPQTEQ